MTSKTRHLLPEPSSRTSVALSRGPDVGGSEDSITLGWNQRVTWAYHLGSLHQTRPWWYRVCHLFVGPRRCCRCDGLWPCVYARWSVEIKADRGMLVRMPQAARQVGGVDLRSTSVEAMKPLVVSSDFADLLDRAALLLPTIAVPVFVRSDIHTSLWRAARDLGIVPHDRARQVADQAIGRLAQFLVFTGQTVRGRSNEGTLHSWTLLRTVFDATDRLRAAARYTRAYARYANSQDRSHKSHQPLDDQCRVGMA